MQTVMLQGVLDKNLQSDSLFLSSAAVHPEPLLEGGRTQAEQGRRGWLRASQRQQEGIQELGSPLPKAPRLRIHTGGHSHGLQAKLLGAKGQKEATPTHGHKSTHARALAQA